MRKPVVTNTHRLNLPELLGPDLPGARCRGEAPYFDTQVPGETAQERRQRTAVAREICKHCPAHNACRSAIRGITGERSGIWAGTPYGRT